MTVYRRADETANHLANRLHREAQHCQAGRKRLTQDGEYCIRKCRRCNRCRAWKVHKEEREAQYALSRQRVVRAARPRNGRLVTR